MEAKDFNPITPNTIVSAAEITCEHLTADEVLRCQRIARSVAYRYGREDEESLASRTELFLEARRWALEGAAIYDPHREVEFGAFVYGYVRSHVAGYVVRLFGRKSNPLGKWSKVALPVEDPELEAELHGVDGSRHQPTAEAGVDAATALAGIRDPLVREIIRMIYVDGYTPVEVAQRFALAMERVREMEVSGLAQARSAVTDGVISASAPHVVLDTLWYPTRRLRRLTGLDPDQIREMKTEHPSIWRKYGERPRSVVAFHAITVARYLARIGYDFTWAVPESEMGDPTAGGLKLFNIPDGEVERYPEYPDVARWEIRSRYLEAVGAEGG